MTLGPLPDFNWSFSRLRTLEACPRRYYWDTYGSWGGWEEDASSEAKLAYRLKKLTNLDFAIGTAIHRRAFELTTLAREGREPPSVDTLRRKTRKELGDLYRACKADFVRDPKYNPMLHGFYYGDGPSEEAIGRVREKLNSCLAELRNLELWEHIRQRTVRVAFSSDPDQFLEPVVTTDGVGIFTTPDLVVFQPGDDEYSLIDWKTGRPSDEDTRQIAVYGLFVRDQFEIAECQGRIIYLIDGSSRTVELTPEVLAETEGWIQDGIRMMRDYVADSDVNRPKPRDCFPLTENRWECRRCSFFELCEEELRSRGALPWE